MSKSLNLVRKVGLWGLPSSGKTVWLASLAVGARDAARQESYSIVGTDSYTQEMTEGWREKIVDEREWPLATELSTLESPFTFEFTSGQLVRGLEFRDFSGEWMKGLLKFKQENRSEADRRAFLDYVQFWDMIMVMIPFDTDKTQQAAVRNSLDILLRELASCMPEGDRLQVPVAVCVSCWDRSCESFLSPEKERERAEKWLMDHYDNLLNSLKARVEESCFRIIPLSSTGHGIICNPDGNTRPPERMLPYNVTEALVWGIPLGEQLRWTVIKNCFERDKSKLTEKRDKDGKRRGDYILETLEAEITNRLPLGHEYRKEAEILKKHIHKDFKAQRMNKVYNKVAIGATVCLSLYVLNSYFVSSSHEQYHRDVQNKKGAVIAQENIDKISAYIGELERTQKEYKQASQKTQDLRWVS